MKTKTFHLICSKYKQICVLLFFLFCANGIANAQSVIYKKDGSQIVVVQLDKEGKSRSYHLLNDAAGVIHYISRNAIDSIRYEDGRVERFSSQIVLPGTEESIDTNQINKINKNFVGFDIWPIFSSSIDIFYERLIVKNKLGFKNYFYLNTVSGFSENFYSFYHRMNYGFSTGLNYYFLQSEMFRFGTGFSVFTGQFDEENWTYYNDYTEVDYNQKKVQRTGMYLNASFGYIWQKSIFFSAEIDAPLFWKAPNNRVLFKTEIAINF
ncbi:MAG TPA: hypothetical protein VKA38_14130 [Draconibacterium sp.]|nr:hypothetical protein [Draconibacterium sp.]